jgi:hypothetical protein
MSSIARKSHERLACEIFALRGGPRLSVAGLYPVT